MKKKLNPDDSALTQRLVEHGLRPTYARRLVLSLLDEKNEHPSTDGILKSLRKRGYRMSPATLYQNLNKLVEAGLLHRLIDIDGLMRFDANLTPHHHLTCNSCGKMADISLDDTKLMQHKPVDFRSGSTMDDWHIAFAKIELNGTCPACRKKKK